MYGASKIFKMTLVVSSSVFEAVYLQRLLKLPPRVLIHTFLNFTTTYAYDWGYITTLGVSLLFTVGGIIDPKTCLFVPFMAATCGYEGVVQKFPWFKNLFVAGMYGMNFIVIPLYIANVNVFTPQNMGILLPYCLRVIAFEMYDDVLDIEEDTKNGRATFASRVGKRNAEICTACLLLLGVWASRDTDAALFHELVFNAVSFCLLGRHFVLLRSWYLFTAALFR